MMNRGADFRGVNKERNRIGVTHHAQGGLGMASHAFLIRDALLVEKTPRPVRLMAIDANRDLVRFLFPQLAANHLGMHILNTPVAFLARTRNVTRMDARRRIGVRENIVRRVTVSAHRRDSQPLLIEAFSVDPERIVRLDRVLRDIVGLTNGRPFFVAATAHEGNLELRHARVGRGWAYYIM